MFAVEFKRASGALAHEAKRMAASAKIVALIFICLLSEKKNYSLEVENYILFDENLLRA